MPYIKKQDRDRLSILTDVIDHVRIDTPGELNYLFTRLAISYIDTKDLSYQTINDIVGALEGAKLEFYRRVAERYETDKINVNGDVY